MVLALSSLLSPYMPLDLPGISMRSHGIHFAQIAWKPMESPGIYGERGKAHGFISPTGSPNKYAANTYKRMYTASQAMSGDFDVAIIGGGVAGIYTLKHCLEAGLRAVVLEKQPRLGGVWNAANKPGAVHDEFTFAVTSKMYLSASDFPVPHDWPEFPHSRLVQAHFMRYVERFGLREHMRLGAEVVGVDREGAGGGGGWRVRTRKADGADTTEVRARHLVVATGANNCPVDPRGAPEFRGFSGRAVHAHYYGPEVRAACAGKRVLIIGGSDTASDLAGDLSKTAARVYMSIRDGQWFQDRMFGATSPADMLYSRFLDFLIKNVIGKEWVHRNFGDDNIRFFWGRGGSDVPQWAPKCDYLNSYYNKSRDVVRLVGHGMVVPCGPVVSCAGNVVSCAGVGTGPDATTGDVKPFEVDIIVYATGYRYGDCLARLIGADVVKLPRHRLVFPIDNHPPNLALVGYVRPYLTSIPMMIELQSRFVASVFSGATTLPPPKRMLEDAEAAAKRQQEEFPCNSGRIPFLVDPYDYANGLATAIGAQPKWGRLLFRDPFIAYCLFFDTWSHFAFRMEDRDPEKRSIARREIARHHSHPSCTRIRTELLGKLVQLVTFITAGMIVLLLTALTIAAKRGGMCSRRRFQTEVGLKAPSDKVLYL